MNLGELVATATLDIAPFQTNTKQLKTYLRGVDSSLKAVEKSISGQGSKIKALRSVYNETGQALKGYQSLLVKQTEKYNALKSNIGDVASATEKEKSQLLGARTAMMDTAAKISELQGRLQSLATEINIFSRMGSAMTNFGNKLTALGTGAVNLGSTLTGAVTTPLVGIGVAAMTTFGNFEQQMNRVKAISGATGGQFDQLKQRAVELGASSVFSASEVAQAMENMASAGMNVNDIYSASAGVMDLAAVSGRDMGLAAEAVASAMNQFGIAGENATHVADVYAKAAADTNAETVDMAEAMKYAGPVMSSLNSSFEETAAAIGIMSNAGIKGSQAGTTLRTAMQRLAAPTDVASKLMQSLGISAYNSEGQMKPISELLPHLKERLSGLSEEQRNNALNTLFGKESLSGMLALLDSAGPEFDGVVSGLQNSNGAAKEMADTMNSGLTGSIENLKGKLETAAITVSERFAPYIEQLADKVGELTEWFTNLSEEQQDQIIKWGLVAAAAGPALVVFGKVAGALGTTFKALGTVSSGIGKVVGKVAPLITKFAGMETAAVGATGATSGLAGAVGLLGNPVTWGVLLGGAALLAVGYFANKAAEAKQRTEEWGTAVSKAQASELQQFKDKVDETNQAMTAFGTDGTADVEAVRSAFKGLVDDITTLADKDLNKKIKLAEKYGLSEEEIQRMKNAAQEAKNNVSAMSDEVIRIYQNAADNHRNITETERAVVKSAQNAMIEEKLSLLGYEKDESIAIRKAMNGEVDQLNTAQAEKGLETVKKWIEEENKSYEQAKKDYKTLYESKALTKAEYNQKLEELEANHNAVMDAYGEQYMELQKKISESALKDYRPEVQQAVTAQIKSSMEELGLSYEEFQAKMEETASSASKASSLVGTYWADMSEEARTAVTYWNSIVLDPKTGDVKTNAQEEIQKALQAEGGWESMKLSVKEGKLTTTATMAIGEALIATGQWDSLSPDDKQLVIDHSPAMKAITESESSLQAWKEIPDATKNLLANNTDFLNNTDVAKTVLENWNALTPEEKALTAKNLTSGDVALAQNTINQLSGKTVDLNANDNTGQPTLDAYIKVNGVAQRAPAGINATDNTAGPTSSAQSKINNVNQKSVPGILASDLTGSPTSRAKTNIASVHGKSVTVTAVDRASGVISGIKGWLNSLHDKVVNIRTNHTKNEKGTNFHPGGLALVNDQKGGTYRELITLPDGTSFIPKDRNVMLPLPRGSKVLPAGKTKQLFPRYANGIGFENTRVADVARRIGNLQSQSDVAVLTDHSDNSNINQALNKLIELVAENTDSLDKLAARQIIIENYMDTERVGRSVAKSVTSEQERQESIKNAIYGKGW